MGENLIIAKILNFRNSNSRTCIMLQNINNFNRLYSKKLINILPNSVLPNSAFWGWLSISILRLTFYIESEPHYPEFKNNPKNLNQWLKFPWSMYLMGSTQVMKCMTSHGNSIDPDKVAPWLPEPNYADRNNMCKQNSPRAVWSGTVSLFSLAHY